MAESNDNANPKTAEAANPAHLTNDQRAQLAMDTGGELFSEVILSAHKIPNLRPIDLPNVFVSCIAHNMKFFANDLKMPPEVMDRVALLAVVSLVMTLSANGRKLEGVIVPKMDTKNLGVTNADGEPVGRA